MHSFVRQFITEWRRLKLPTASGTVVAAVSGGADSVSLLLAVDDLIRLGKLKVRLVAAHFNHGLRDGESDADQEFVRQLSIKRGIELAIGKGSIPSEGNLEQNARDHRYAFLGEVAGDVHAFAVLTGHTVNDQAETFLMNLIRGSGPDGLAAMPAIRPLNNSAEDGGETVNLVRPLLTWAIRKQTEGFCRDSGVEPRYDTMNEDTAFKRVRIRKVLLPLLEEMNPNIISTLAATAGLMSHRSAPAKSVEPTASAKPNLEIRSLKKLAEPELFTAVRGWLGEMRGTTRQLQLKHIEAVVRLAFSTKSGKTAELPGGGRVRRSGGKLTFEKNKVEN